jgi:hypothetical protein
MRESGAFMALKPVTLRLDEDEYEKLQKNLASFGDPDINVAYVLRCYIRDLNRALPFLEKSRWDLKNYFAFLGVLLKQFGTMTDVDAFTKGMFDWTQYWKHAMGMSVPKEPSDATASKEKP